VDGNFVAAKPMKGTVLVNIADMMQRWTADRFKSTVFGLDFIGQLLINLNVTIMVIYITALANIAKLTFFLWIWAQENAPNIGLRKKH